MAEALVGKIQEEITCPICFDTFEDPKMLPCQHVFCRVCLEHHARPGTVSCPICRNVVQIPQIGMKGLPPALGINKLKDLYQDLPDTPSFTDCAATTTVTTGATTSKVHQCNEIWDFCESCQKPICRECIIYGEHATHKHVPLTAPKYRAFAFKKLAPVSHLQKQLCNAITDVSQMKQKIEKHKADLAKEVDASFDALDAVLLEQKQSLQREIEAITNCKIHAITAQEQELVADQKELQRLIDQTESATKMESPDQELLLTSQRILEKIGDVTRRANSRTLVPVQIPNVAVKTTPPEELRLLCMQHRSIYFSIDPSKCTVEGSGNQGGETGRMSTFTVHLLDSQGRPCTTSHKVTAELKPLRLGSKMDASTVTAQVDEANFPSQCTVSYQPQTRGRHQLSVKVDGTHIAGSPFQVFIQHPPTKLDVQVDKISYSQDVTGLLHTDGKLFVGTGNNNGISVLDYNFEGTTLIGRGQLQDPRGLGIDGHSSLYVTTCKDHRLHKFTKDGTHVKCVGRKGANLGRFNSPKGIAVSRDGRVYVCDTNNHRIQVLDSELNLLPEIGSKGSANGKFKQPSAIDFDSSGYMYVADSDNHRIQVLTREGRYLQSFGKNGKKPGHLGKPINIKVVGNYLYVVEKENNRISVFSTSGHFITMFGKEHLVRPEGIAVDADGFVYVSSDKKNIVVF